MPSKSPLSASNSWAWRAAPWPSRCTRRPSVAPPRAARRPRPRRKRRWRSSFSRCLPELLPCLIVTWCWLFSPKKDTFIPFSTRIAGQHLEVLGSWRPRLVIHSLKVTYFDCHIALRVAVTWDPQEISGHRTWHQLHEGAGC